MICLAIAHVLFEGVADSRHRSPAREGWFENVKCHGPDISRGGIDFGAQIGSAGDVQVSAPKIVVFRGMEGMDRSRTTRLRIWRGRNRATWTFSDRVCQRAVKGAKGDYCTTGWNMCSARREILAGVPDGRNVE